MSVASPRVGFYLWLRTDWQSLGPGYVEVAKFIFKPEVEKMLQDYYWSQMINSGTSKDAIEQIFLECGADFEVMDALAEVLIAWESRMKRLSPVTAQKKSREAIPPSLRMTILQRDRFRCRYCGQDASDGVKLEVDHVYPVSKGGSTTESNLQTLCFSCNRGKRDQIIN